PGPRRGGHRVRPLRPPGGLRRLRPRRARHRAAPVRARLLVPPLRGHGDQPDLPAPARDPGTPVRYGRAGAAGPGRAAPAPVLPPRGRPPADRRLPDPGRLRMRYLRQIKELNQVEQWKLERHPLDVGADVLHAYAQASRAALMLRIKIPGGRLEADQARAIGEIADEFARGPAPNPVFGDAYLDLTTRQDIQLHWVRIGAVPEIWTRLEAVGMTTVQACGDSARNVLCCPVSGLDADEVLDAHPVAQAVSDFFTGNREYANLPRKFKLSVTGCREDCAQAEINDIGLWPARLDDGTGGFNVLVGGGVSDGARVGGGARGRGQGGVQRAGRRRALGRPADGLRHRRVRPSRPRPGGRAVPGHRSAVRRAGQPREPRPGADALPGPGAGPRAVPGRAGLPGRVRSGGGRPGPDPPPPRRRRRRAPTAPTRARLRRAQ